VATEVLTSERGLQALVPEWRRLAVARANAFITPDWYLAWLRANPGEVEPWVFALRDGAGELTALLPLTRSTVKPFRLRLAGSSLGDVFEPVAADPADEHALLEALGLALDQDRSWRSLLLENVPAEADWLDGLKQAGSRLHLTPIPHRDEVLPSIPLAGGDWDAYLAKRSRNFRSQLGRKLRGLEREGEVGFRLSEGRDRLEPDMQAFFKLHDARWEGRGGSQALTARSREFHLDFAAAALQNGWLRLWLLELDSAPIAAWYGWSLGGRYAYYLAGFDQSWSRYSVGQLLLAHTIESAFAEGADTYDLLLGSEDYKARFAEASREVETVAVTRRWSKDRVAVRAESLARRAADGLTPGVRAAIKRPLRGIARRLPSRVER
jgi:CelD/BcsL family acetyltransferase involved in cellulose biosynthesis